MDLTSSPTISLTIGLGSEEKTTEESVAIMKASSTMVTDSVEVSSIVSTPKSTATKSEVEDTSSTVESSTEILISTSTETSKSDGNYNRFNFNVTNRKRIIHNNHSNKP